MALLHIVCVVGVLASASEETRITYLPDDAFYYLQLAKTHATQGIWSVDGGASVTSGFHPLMAYALSGAWLAVQPSDASFVTLGMALTGCLAVLAALGLLRLAHGLDSRVAALAALLVIASRNYVLNAVSVMEWAVVVGLAASYVRLGVAFAGAPGWLGPRLACLGFCGSLARSDFALLPACLMLASSLRQRQALRWPERRWVIGCFGSLAGIAAVMAHGYVTSGQVIPSSALMKAHWGTLSGTNLWAPLRLLGELVGCHGVCCLALTLAALYDWRRSPPAPAALTSCQARVGLAGATALVGYLLVYSQNGSVQPWYTSTLIVPCICCAARLETMLSRTPRTTKARMWLLSTALLIGTVGTFMQHPLRGGAPWPHQRSMLEAGRYLRTTHFEGRVGSWNSGVIGYYAGGTVINLDGLVNNDIYPYAVANRLADYASSMRVEYLADFSRMIDDPERRRRGGYDDPAFLDTLHVVKAFGSEHPYWGQLALYERRR